MKPTVYMIGKMTGLSLEEMSKWRREATDMLTFSGFRVLSPVNTILDPNPREIQHSNMFQLKNSHVMLAELDHPEPSLSSVSEITAAGIFGKPVITWGSRVAYKNAFWVLEYTTRHFLLMEDAVQYIIENYYL